MNKAYVPFVVLLISLCFLAVSIYILREIPGLIQHSDNSTDLIKSREITTTALQAIDKVLSRPITANFETYQGTFEEPFRTYGAVSNSGSSSGISHVTPSRKKLLLKGMLFKNKLLAILADESGETFIRGVGESVDDQTITKIENTSVTLRDKKGSYQLSVEEK